MSDLDEIRGRIDSQARIIDGLRDYIARINQDRFEALDAIQFILSCRKYGRGGELVVMVPEAEWQALCAKYAPGS